MEWQKIQFLELLELHQQMWSREFRRAHLLVFAAQLKHSRLKLLLLKNQGPQ